MLNYLCAFQIIYVMHVFININKHFIDLCMMVKYLKQG